MAITVYEDPYAQYTGPGLVTTDPIDLTITHQLQNPSGADRKVIVCIGTVAGSDHVINTPTYNGVSPTRALTFVDDGVWPWTMFHAWEFDDVDLPTVAGSYTVSGSITNSNNRTVNPILSVFELAGVKQGAPASQAEVGKTASVSSMSYTGTSDLQMMLSTVRSANASTSFTPQTGDTMIIQSSALGGGSQRNSVAHVYSTDGTAGYNISPDGRPNALGVSYQNASGGGVAEFISVTANTDGTTGTVHQISGVTVQAGDCIVVHCKYEDATVADITVTDDSAGGSNTYTKRLHLDQGLNNPSLAIATAVAQASETLTITITYSSTAKYRRSSALVGRPASGKTFLYDNGAIAAANSPNYSTGAFTVAGTGGIASEAVAEFKNTSYTPGTGWIERLDQSNHFVASRILTTETSITGEASGAGMKHVIGAVAFKFDAGGGGGGGGGGVLYLRQSVNRIAKGSPVQQSMGLDGVLVG